MNEAIQIPLTQGFTTQISPEDYDLVAQYPWCISKSRGKFYARRGQHVNGRIITILMHRVIMNAPDDMEVDHINGDGLDNRRENLRLCVHRQNAGNVQITKVNKSGFKGVYRNSSGWAAGIASRYLGTFTTAEEAARCYDSQARLRFGSFAKLNFPDETTNVPPRIGAVSNISTTGFRGVSRKGNLWGARVTINGERLFLGAFKTPEEANAAIEAKRAAVKS